MKLRVILPLGFLLACQEPDLLGPLPEPGAHLTALVASTPFVGNVEASSCIGFQITPTLFVVEVHSAGTWPTPRISLHLGGITGVGRFGIRPDEVQEAQRAVLYIPGDPALLQYSAPAGSGEILIDEYDPLQRLVAGRFYFNALRVVGTGGSEWIEVRQGSFRGKLRAWGASECS